MAWLQNLDATVFYWINNLGSNAVFDFLLPLFREKLFWAPLYLFVVVFIFQHFGKGKGAVVVLGLVAAVGLADFTSSTLIKKNVQRLRPCNEPALRETIVLRVSCGSGYSFTSSHAANHFAAAIFLGMILGHAPSSRIRIGLVAWAFSVAFAQVYVGVHYPADVLGGALLGMAIGWWVGYLVIGFTARR
ncbi:MAG: phosphatase PAP2 family protein [Saprospiraceae bacterium]